MKLSGISIRNFRRLENVTIDVEDKDTIFVGPNNSRKDFGNSNISLLPRQS